MAMWLVSLNRKKKGHDNHAPTSSMRKYVLLMPDTSGTFNRLRARRLISTAAKPNSAVSTHSGQLPVRAYGVSPVVGVTFSGQHLAGELRDHRLNLTLRANHRRNAVVGCCATVGAPAPAHAFAPSGSAAMDQ